MITVNAPTLLFWFTFVLLMIGLLTLIWGNRLPGKGAWLLWVGVLLVLVGAGLESGLFLREDFHSKVWSIGWILPKADTSALTVGIYQDLFGVFFFVLAALVSAGFLLNGGFNKHAHPEKTIASLAISASGVGLVSLSLTPWMCFIGLALTVFGGGLSYGSHWENDSEARVAIRFLWQNSIGLLLTFIGASVLVSGQFNLFLNESAVWSSEGGAFSAAVLGSLLMILGLFIQAHPFPVLGWVVAESKQCPPQRTLLNQIFPVWVGFILMLRLEPQFRTLGLLPSVGWAAAGASVLTVICGLFQKNWRVALGLWVVAGFSLSFAILAFTGRNAALAFLLGVSLSAISQANLGNALEEKISTHSPKTKAKAKWLKGLSFVSAASGSGCIGFLTMSGGIQWLEKMIESPVMAASFLFFLVLFGLLSWCLAWRVVRLNQHSGCSWSVFVSSGFWLLLSMSIWWTGTLTGGAVMDFSDRLMPSLLELIFGVVTPTLKDPTDFWSVTSMYWGGLIFAVLAAYWTSGRKEDQWNRLSVVFPRVIRFIASGFEMDHFYKRCGRILTGLGRLAEKGVDQKIWSVWIPKGIKYFLENLSDRFRRMDSTISAIIGGSVRRIIEVPGKTLQLIQTGDLRWYLFFVVFSGFEL